MTVYLLIVAITQWLGHPGYTPDIIIHHNRTLAEQEYAYYRSFGSVYVVSLSKQWE